MKVSIQKNEQIFINKYLYQMKIKLIILIFLFLLAIIQVIII